MYKLLLVLVLVGCGAEGSDDGSSDGGTSSAGRNERARVQSGRDERRVEIGAAGDGGSSGSN